jgi:hypothetical protein
MASTGQGRLLRSGMVGLQGLRYPARQETANGSGLAAALGDYWWGGYPPPPTQIPHGWLTPPARWRPAPPANTAAVTRTGGSTDRSTDRASVLAIGERPYTATLNTTVVDDPIHLATYVTTYYTTPRQRMPEILLNLVGRTPTECWRILSRRIGDRISIVGAPETMLTIARDDFTRIAAGDWTAPDVGPPWLLAGGSGADYGVNGGHGNMAIPSTGVERTAALADMGADVDVTVTLFPTVVAGGAQTEQKVRVRHNGSTWFETGVQYQTSGLVDLYLTRGVTILSALGSVLPYNASTALNARLQAIGSTIRHKLWDASGSQPDAWTASVTDGSLPGSASDKVMLVGNRIGGNTDAGLVLQFDGLAVATPNPTAWPAGVTELVIEGIEHTIGSDDARWVRWKTAPVVGSTPGTAGPWFRLGESRTGGTDLLPF